MLHNSSSVMKDRHRNHKGNKWKGRYLSNSLNKGMSGSHLSNNLRLLWSNEEWNAEVKMAVVEMYNRLMIITSSVETDREKEEGMVRK